MHYFTKSGNRIPGASLLFCLLSLIAMLSCSTEEVCIDPTLSRVNINFYQVVNGEEVDSTLLGLTVNTLPAKDTILYDSLNLQTISLPLSQLSEISAFVFTYSMPDTSYIEDTIQLFDRIGNVLKFDTIPVQDTFAIVVIAVRDTIWRDSIFEVPVVEFYPLYDTITFSYKSELGMISDECGFTNFFTLTEIEYTTHNMINIIISDAEITNQDEENIKILF